MTHEKHTLDIEKDVTKLEKQKIAHDGDEALNAIEELQGETVELDQHTNKRLLSIIDWHLMPIMCFVYGMNYLDSMVFVFTSAWDYRCVLSYCYRNDAFLCQCHGHQDGSKPSRGSISVVREFVLLWYDFHLFCLY